MDGGIVPTAWWWAEGDLATLTHRTTRYLARTCDMGLQGLIKDGLSCFGCAQLDSRRTASRHAAPVVKPMLLYSEELEDQREASDLA